MKIIHIVRQFYPCIGGLEIYVKNLACLQAERGHKVRVITLNIDFKNNKKLNRYDVLDGLEILRIPYIGSNRYPLAFDVLKYIENSDIINVHAVDFFIDYLTLTKFIHKKKIILHTHGGFFHTQWMYLFKKLFFYTITRFSIQKCDRIIAISHNDYKVFNKLTNNITIIPCGVDLQKFSKNDIQRGTDCLTYLGRIDRHKRIDLLIELIYQASLQNIYLRLKIIGPDWASLKPELLALIQAYKIEDRIEFLGELSEQEVVKNLCTTDFFVSASEYEGFGMALIEGMAAGGICLLQNNDAFKSLIKDNENGYIVNFKNIGSVLDQIRTIQSFSQTKKENIRSLARDEAKKYSWEHIVDKVLKVYQEVL